MRPFSGRRASEQKCLNSSSLYRSSSVIFRLPNGGSAAFSGSPFDEDDADASPDDLACSGTTAAGGLAWDSVFFSIGLLLGAVSFGSAALGPFFEASAGLPG